jgi:formylmethanofuran dehydrogenase subunit E
MGPKFSKKPVEYQAPDRYSKVGKNTECPMCGEAFSKGTTMMQVEEHILICSTDAENA